MTSPGGSAKAARSATVAPSCPAHKHSSHVVTLAERIKMAKAAAAEKKAKRKYRKRTESSESEDETAAFRHADLV
jgi:hypothetical protein